jgi:hypothetical protein
LLFFDPIDSESEFVGSFPIKLFHSSLTVIYVYLEFCWICRPIEKVNFATSLLLNLIHNQIINSSNLRRCNKSLLYSFGKNTNTLKIEISRSVLEDIFLLISVDFPDIIEYKSG